MQVAIRAKPSRVGKSPCAVRSLRTQLREAKEALRAIRAGEVDALVVEGPAGERVFTLEGAQHGYRVLMEAMSEGVATLAERGLITYCNARFADILGVPLARTMGSPIFGLAHGADRERLRALLASGASGRSEGEFWLQAREAGTPALVRLAVVSLILDGARTHCLVMTDLTAQRRESVAIAAVRAQLKMRLLLADRMSSLCTLAAGLAHEINNPLAYVLSSLDLMSKRLEEIPSLGTEPSEGLRRQLDRAHGGAERMRLLVLRLKAFSRADDESMGAIDPRHTLDASILLVSNEIHQVARLVKDYDALPMLWANEARLEQVFVNLLVNATQSIATGAALDNEIRVSGRTDAEGRAVIEFHDTGSGIDPAHLALIFDPFFTTKALHVGTGLGLSLSYAIIGSLDGQITVESEPGVGSTFRVVLPALPALEGAVPVVVLPTAAAAHATDSRGRLLFIDDERDICAVMEEALSESHDVVAISDARRALELLATGERFDLILCDVRMPEMTGIDFYARLHADNDAQARRVVLMSGGFRTSQGDPSMTLPRPLLEKPFTVAQVLSLMREAMQRDPVVAA
jgi:signal transduction histidine kinase